MRSTLIQTFPISIGPGNSTVFMDVDLINLSWCKSLSLEMTIPSIAAAAGDSLDVKFQETRDPNRLYYDTRGRFKAVAGNTAASASTPYADQMTISQDVDLTAPDRNPTPTGSSTGTEIPAGTVRNGPFAPPIRGNTGRKATQRVAIITTGPGTAAYTGTVQLWGHEW